jgi:transcription initiation factor TFIIIB Brf1 subunit/transcription initiation factor TFIIB
METNWDIFDNISKSFSDEDNSDPEEGEEGEDSKNICKYCNSDKLEEINSKMECTTCGAINKYITSYTKDVRYYGSNDNKRTSDPNRCGMPLNQLFSNNSLCTSIIGKNNEILKKYNNYNGISYGERSLIDIEHDITKKIRNEHMPKCIVDKALVYYKTFRKHLIKRAASRHGIISTCYKFALDHYANQDIEMMRSFQEIAKMFNVKEKKLSRGCYEFTEIMYRNNPDFIKKFKPIEPKDLIVRFCSLLGINDEYKKIAIDTVIKVGQLGICQDNNPKSIAVGAIYLVSQVFGLGLSGKIISEKCGISKVTIVNTCSQMNKFKKYIFNIEKNNDSK